MGAVGKGCAYVAMIGVGFFVLLVLIGLMAPAKRDAVDVTADSPPASFSFRGLVPAVTTQAQATKSGTVRSCFSSDKDEVECDFTKLNVGGAPTWMGRSYATFTKGKFDWFTFRTRSSDFERLRTSLMYAYGKPCRETSKPMQNAFGAVVAGDEAVWCFKEGNLTLRRHSNAEDNFTNGDLDFFSFHADQKASEPIPDSNNI